MHQWQMGESVYNTFESKRKGNKLHFFSNSRLGFWAHVGL